MQINYGVLEECIMGEKEISNEVSQEILPFLRPLNIKLKKSLVGNRFGKVNLTDINPLPFFIALSHAQEIFPYLDNNSFSKEESNLVFFEYLKIHYKENVSYFIDILKGKNNNLLRGEFKKSEFYLEKLSNLNELRYQKVLSFEKDMKYMSFEIELNNIKKSFVSNLVRKDLLLFEKSQNGTNYFNFKDSFKYVVKIPKAFLKL